LFVFDIIGGGKRIEELEKSIAVLPFLNDSPDEENTYFINGIMDEVLINLQTMKDLRVLSRSSIEQYRDPSRPTSPEIAKKLDVNYIVEGCGQKYGNTFRLRIQLIEAAKDRHLWGEVYEQKIEGVEDIFRIQSQVAEAIANELKAIITPEEEQLIEKTPTTNLTAYDFFQRGKEDLWEFWMDNNNREALERAEDLYHEALEYDSTFAQAYTGLAWVYYNKHYWETILSEDFLDSVLVLADIALSYDDQLSEAYTIRGRYYREMEKTEQAINEFDKAIKLNPNDWMAYWGKGQAYSGIDKVKTIENLLKTISLYRGSLLPGLLRYIDGFYRDVGFMEKAKNYAEETFKLDKDSIRYYQALADIEYCSENFEDAIKYLGKAYALDTNNTGTHRAFGEFYMMTGNYERTLEHLKKWLERSKSLSEGYLFGMHRVGWAYWQNGYKEQGEYYFNVQIDYCNRMKDLGRVYGENARIYYDLAGVYAFMGEKEKAYENLRFSNQELPI